MYAVIVRNPHSFRLAKNGNKSFWQKSYIRDKKPHDYSASCYTTFETWYEYPNASKSYTLYTFPPLSSKNLINVI